MLGFNILQSTLPALSALAARGSNKIATTRTRDTTRTGHRLKAFEDLRCQTDREQLSGADFVMKKMECLGPASESLKPKPPNLIPAFISFYFLLSGLSGFVFRTEETFHDLWHKLISKLTGAVVQAGLSVEITETARQMRQHLISFETTLFTAFNLGLKSSTTKEPYSKEVGRSCPLRISRNSYLVETSQLWEDSCC